MRRSDRPAAENNPEPARIEAARQIVFEMTEADAFLRDWQAKEVD